MSAPPEPSLSDVVQVRSGYQCRVRIWRLDDEGYTAAVTVRRVAGAGHSWRYPAVGGSHGAPSLAALAGHLDERVLSAHHALPSRGAVEGTLREALRLARELERQGDRRR